MNFSTISILMPTRGRTQRLDRAIKSIRNLAYDSTKIEIIFRCDHDDEETQKYLNENKEIFIVGPREKGYASLPKFMNQCANISTGDLIIMLNDDILVETKDWDIRLLEFANKYEDGIFNIGITTGLNDDLFPFSIISRKTFQALGFVNDERLVFSDIFLLDVMSRLGRAIRLPIVRIIHEWAGLDGYDKTRNEAAKHENHLVFDGTPGDASDPKKNWKKEYKVLHDDAVTEAVEKLKTTILDSRRMLNNEVNSSNSKTESIKIGQNLYPSEQWNSLLKQLNNKKIIGKTAFLAPLRNKNVAKIWGGLFQEVFALEYSNNFDSSTFYSYESFENVKIYKGPIAKTDFLFHFRDICLGPQSRINNPINCLIIDNEQYPISSYPISMAIYFVMRKLLSPGASIIFIHEGKNNNSYANNDQFVKHLEQGIDGYRHSIESIREKKNGKGFSLEIFDSFSTLL